MERKNKCLIVLNETVHKGRETKCRVDNVKLLKILLQPDQKFYNITDKYVDHRPTRAIITTS